MHVNPKVEHWEPQESHGVTNHLEDVGPLGKIRTADVGNTPSRLSQAESGGFHFVFTFRAGQAVSITHKQLPSDLQQKLRV